MILSRWCYHGNLKLVIKLICFLMFIIYSSQLLNMNIEIKEGKSITNNKSYINFNYDKLSQAKTNNCLDLFTTPLIKKIVKDKLEYQKSFKNHRASHYWKSIMTVNKSDNPPFTYAPYEALAMNLPPLLTEKMETSDSLPKILRYLPWVRCGLRQYDSMLSSKCAQDHRAPQVMLLGDSRLRELALQLLENWKHLNLTVTTQKGSLPYNNYMNIFSHPQKNQPGPAWMGADDRAQKEFVKHSDIHVTSGLAPELNVEYIYSGFLKEDQVFGDLLKPSIVQVLRDLNTKDHWLPSLMVIGTGTWTLYGDKLIRYTNNNPEALRNLDWLIEGITESETEIRGALQQLREKDVTVLWMLQDNVKYNVVDWDKMYFLPIYNFIFEWINEILLNTLMKLHDEGLVILWDSNVVISSKVFQACRQLMRSKSGLTLGHSRQWQCNDITHMGPQASARYAQILLNYLCNEEHHLCCGDY